MRFYELATKIGIEKKDYQAFLDYADSCGYKCKNSLSTVSSAHLDWASNLSEYEIQSCVQKYKVKNKERKRVPARRQPEKQKNKNTDKLEQDNLSNTTKTYYSDVFDKVELDYDIISILKAHILSFKSSWYIDRNIKAYLSDYMATDPRRKVLAEIFSSPDTRRVLINNDSSRVSLWIKYCTNELFFDESIVMWAIKHWLAACSEFDFSTFDSNTKGNYINNSATVIPRTTLELKREQLRLKKEAEELELTRKKEEVYMLYQQLLGKSIDSDSGEITKDSWKSILYFREEYNLSLQEYTTIEQRLWNGLTIDEICKEYTDTYTFNEWPFNKYEAKCRQILTAKAYNKQIEICLNITGVPMEFILIPAGEFMMGSDSSEASRAEQPVHKVHITKPFYMGKYPVTNEQYKALIPYHNSGGYKGHDLNNVNHPVVRISWEEINNKYLPALNERLSGEYKARFSSESEWEYSCRAGTDTEYYWGNNFDSSMCNSNKNVSECTTSVGSYDPNAFGLYDMLGNVWEWCADYYDDDAYAKTGTNGHLIVEKSSDRVLRGGSWFNKQKCSRSAYRLMYYQGGSCYSQSVRILLDFPSVL